MEYSSLEYREIGRFIRTRRENADPSAFAALPRRRRHVQHLTQEDLAELAGVSSVVVSQIEQARYRNLNPSILRKIAQAMNLPPEHQVYMVGLLERASHAPLRDVVPDWVHSTTRDTSHPITVVNPCFDILAWNRQASAMLGDFSQVPPEARNGIVAMFLSPQLADLMVGIDDYRTNMVSAFKMFFSIYPAYRSRILEIAREIEEHSEAFRVAWDTADPFSKPPLEKTLNHPELGALNVYEIVGEILGEEGLLKIEFLPSDDETREKMRML